MNENASLGTFDVEQYRADREAKAAADRKRFPSESERRQSLRWTERFDRPTAETVGPVMLEKSQQIWDEAEAQRQTHVAAVEGLEARRKEREAAQQAKHDAKHQERIQADDAKLVDGWRRAFFAADRSATEDDFQAALPEIRRQHRLDAALGRTPTPEIKSLVDARSF